MKRILVLSTSWGHGSIANGVYEAIKGSHKTSLHMIPVEPFSKVSYEFIYKFAPSFFRVVFKLAEVKFLRRLFYIVVESGYLAPIKYFIGREKPDIVINTYFAFNSSLEELMQKYGFSLINVFADPLTFSRVLISDKAKNLVFDEYSVKKLKGFAPKAEGGVVGWFTEKKYFDIQKTPRKTIRRGLGLDPEKFTLCVVSGSEGTFNIFKILKTFLDPKYNIQIIILCGNNKGMLNAVEALKTISKTIKGPKIYGIPYTNEMQKYLRASDLVVGKAGPNTIFESVATLTPFFAISHVSGQEDGNLDIIRRYKIGVVEERPIEATKRLEKIIENPKILSQFNPGLRRLANYCRSSDERILKILEP